MIVIIFIIILTLGNSACVLLEGEPEDGDLLVRDRVEQALHDPLGESQPDRHNDDDDDGDDGDHDRGHDHDDDDEDPPLTPILLIIITNSTDTDMITKSPLEVVEGDNLGPVFGHFWQVQTLAVLIIFMIMRGMMMMMKNVNLVNGNSLRH